MNAMIFICGTLYLWVGHFVIAYTPLAFVVFSGPTYAKIIKFVFAICTWPIAMWIM